MFTINYTKFITIIPALNLIVSIIISVLKNSAIDPKLYSVKNFKYSFVYCSVFNFRRYLDCIFMINYNLLLCFIEIIHIHHHKFTY